MSRRLHATAFGAALSAASFVAASARADDPICFSAPVDGQQLQREGKLVAAREKFAACASATCPREIADDCTRWVRGVDDALPSAVVVARDEEGHDLADAEVAIDGAPKQRVSALAIQLDPGSHEIVFWKDSRSVQTTVLLREGEKNRSVVGVFTMGNGLPTPPVSEPAPQRPVPVATWMFGSIGAVALGTFAAFGTLGVVERGDKRCGVGCAPDDKDSVDRKLRIADISLAVAVIAGGLATVFWLTRPTVTPPRAAAAR